MKKKLLIASLLSISLLFTGCSRQLEIYNNKDKVDFQNGAVIKFQIVQFKNILDEKTLKEMNVSGGFFVCMGGASVQSKETTELSNTYYMYVKNKNGAIYFASIPYNKIRIYEDSNTPYLIGNMNEGFDDSINSAMENQWDEYDMFNLHIPKGTIIPKINYNFNVNNIKK